ncbi:MAG: HEPN domain-containing protein, partial [Armatimonadetes bacterium]|nr:HEPN domain-containing protein [Armatimonadota bacterium]
MPLKPGSPLDWIRHAQSDLAVAEHSIAPSVLYETLCYHTQQSVEKSLKAVLLHDKIEFPYTHN